MRLASWIVRLNPSSLDQRMRYPTRLRVASFLRRCAVALAARTLLRCRRLSHNLTVLCGSVTYLRQGPRRTAMPARQRHMRHSRTISRRMQ